MNQNTKVFSYIISSYILVALLFTGCRRDENQGKYVIKGKLLYSCEKPEPVSGGQLFLEFSYGINNKYEKIPTTSRDDGSFEFTYEKKRPMGEMIISGRQSNDVVGIPVGRDLDIGNLYTDVNAYAIIRIKTMRQTSSDDTIFYHKVAGQPTYKSFIAGPFIDGQILDTLSYNKTQFYDIENYRTYLEFQPTGAYYPYKLSSTKNIEYSAMLAGKPFDDICFKYNDYEIVIK